MRYYVIINVYISMKEGEIKITTTPSDQKRISNCDRTQRLNAVFFCKTWFGNHVINNCIFVVDVTCIIMIEQVATRACLIFPSA